MPDLSEQSFHDVVVRLETITLRVGGRWLLPGTSWTIRQGQNWVVLGANGSGKTSLTAALTGEVPVVAGRRWLNADLIREQNMARMAFDTHQRLIAREEALDETLEFAGKGEAGPSVRALLQRCAKADGAVQAIAERLALAPLLHQPLRSLSTGEMRRFLLARALLRKPRLLILDEPFDGLDPAMRGHFADIVAGLVQEGLQTVMVTHRQEEILPVMTHYLILDEEGVRAQGRLPLKPSFQEEADEKAQPVATPVHAFSALPVREVASGNRPLVQMVGVSVAYNERCVVQQLDWCVRGGENWLVSGPNGAGKSTLLRLISADHLQAYANDIFLFGRKRGTGESIWEIKQDIGLVSSEFQVRYRKPVNGYQVVLSGFFDSVGLFRHAGPGQRKQARNWIGRLGLEKLAEARFDLMSSGQQRMVLIARAVVKDPQLLILDEPCQGLDAANRARVLDIAARIGSETPTNLIFTTHHAGERPPCMTHELRLFGDGSWGCRRLTPLKKVTT